MENIEPYYYVSGWDLGMWSDGHARLHDAFESCNAATRMGHKVSVYRGSDNAWWNPYRLEWYDDEGKVVK